MHSPANSGTFFSRPLFASTQTNELPEGGVGSDQEILLTAPRGALAQRRSGEHRLVHSQQLPRDFQRAVVASVNESGEYPVLHASRTLPSGCHGQCAVGLARSQHICPREFDGRPRGDGRRPEMHIFDEITIPSESTYTASATGVSFAGEQAHLCFGTEV